MGGECPLRPNFDIKELVSITLLLFASLVSDLIFPSRNKNFTLSFSDNRCTTKQMGPYIKKLG